MAGQGRQGLGRLAEWFHRGGGEMKVGGDYVLLTNSLGKEGEKICWGKVIEMDPRHAAKVCLKYWQI